MEELHVRNDEEVKLLLLLAGSGTVIKERRKRAPAAGSPYSVLLCDVYPHESLSICVDDTFVEADY